MQRPQTHCGITRRPDTQGGTAKYTTMYCQAFRHEFNFVKAFGCRLVFVDRFLASSFAFPASSSQSPSVYSFVSGPDFDDEVLLSAAPTGAGGYLCSSY